MGIDRSCCLAPAAMVNLCRDEVTATLKHKIDQVHAEPSSALPGMPVVATAEQALSQRAESHAGHQHTYQVLLSKGLGFCWLQVFGSSFNTNGLGGVLTCGVTGVSAGLSHAPVSATSGGVADAPGEGAAGSSAGIGHGGACGQQIEPLSLVLAQLHVMKNC